jgi:hypothetical protein
MTWLVLRDDDTVTVQSRDYVQSQPVSYDQIADVIDRVRRRGRPVHARIDVSGLRLSHVNMFGVIRIIWELHEETYGEDLLSSIEFEGVSPIMRACWETIKKNVPSFIAELPVRMKMISDTE